MQILDVPVFNEDGSVQFTQTLTAAEARVLLQFGLNYFASLGLHTRIVEAMNERNPDSSDPILTPMTLASNSIN
jgi:hypothetical protein